MSGASPVILSPDEQKLLMALREIPPSRLRDLMTTLVGELCDFVSSTRLRGDAGGRRAVPHERRLV